MFFANKNHFITLFRIIDVGGFMKPPKVLIFRVKNIRETTKTIKIINETRLHKKKASFLFKILY